MTKDLFMAGLTGLAGFAVGAMMVTMTWWSYETRPSRAGKISEDDSARVREMLHAQDAAWNAGDLDGFMAGYWRDPELTFFAEAKVEKGYDELRERYRKKYQAGGQKDMGRLTFSDLDVTGPFGAGWATARGRWKVEKDGKTSQGLFTLTLRRMAGEWKIVHDHTSAGTPPP